MLPIFCVDNCLISSPSEDKIDKLYASIQEIFKKEDDRDLNKYPGIELERHSDGSIYLRQPSQTQIILNMIPGMYKSSATPTPVIKPPQEKNKVYKARKMTLITDQ